MINLKDYISNKDVTGVCEWQSQIQPNLSHSTVTNPVDYNDKQCITSDTDKIHVEFEYYGDKIKHNINYKDISKYDDNTRWEAIIKSKKHINIKYKITGQTTGTGRYGISIVDMEVFIIINGQEEKTPVTPKCCIYSDNRTAETFNKDYIDGNNL